jgi:hypothetical protein
LPQIVTGIHEIRRSILLEMSLDDSLWRRRVHSDVSADEFVPMRVENDLGLRIDIVPVIVIADRLEIVLVFRHCAALSWWCPRQGLPDTLIIPLDHLDAINSSIHGHFNDE